MALQHGKATWLIRNVKAGENTTEATVTVYCSKHHGTASVIAYHSGPVKSLILNTQESTRALACSAELASNMTKERLKLRLAPLRNIMKELKVISIEKFQK